MPYAVIYALIGYLSGSVLYAEVFCGIFGRKNAIEQSRDANPGTANAFLYGGFWCGICTLIFDMAKGFVPVYAYVHMTQMNLAESNGLALVLAAPVAGHIFPVWHHFKGGKGIAATAGIIFSIDWRLTVLCLAVFILIVAVTRYVSLGSLVVSVILLAWNVYMGKCGAYNLSAVSSVEYGAMTAVIAAMAFWRHRANIIRLIHGNENKVGAKKS